VRVSILYWAPPYKKKYTPLTVPSD
jgi:hypothetical protein